VIGALSARKNKANRDVPTPCISTFPAVGVMIAEAGHEAAGAGAGVGTGGVGAGRGPEHAASARTATRAGTRRMPE
jgi:hypothetical protein